MDDLVQALLLVCPGRLLVHDVGPRVQGSGQLWKKP